MDGRFYEEKREKAKTIYEANRVIKSPYFRETITLNADGFHHLRYSVRRERSKEEQVLKFTLLRLGLRILGNATTVQEYRKLLPRRRNLWVTDTLNCVWAGEGGNC